MYVCILSLFLFLFRKSRIEFITYIPLGYYHRFYQFGHIDKSRMYFVNFTCSWNNKNSHWTTDYISILKFSTLTYHANKLKPIGYCNLYKCLGY